MVDANSPGMIAGVDSTSADEIWEKMQYKKSSVPYTWSELMSKIIWKYFFFVLILQIAFTVASIMYAFGLHSVPIKRASIVWVFVVYYETCLGMTAGAHRLWSHRSYKAKLPLRILLMIFYSTGGGNPLYYWVRDHRVHHKYSETDADPHNVKRGFVFAHIGWLIMKRHPENIRREREVNMSDIEADPVVMFQKKYVNVLGVIFSFVIPTVVPIMFWGETILHAVLTQCVLRYWFAHNCAFTVNSVSHLWGSRPYNRFINPSNSAIVSFLVAGEGSHNYHHTFPWDYKGSEMPFGDFNTTTLFLHCMAKIGWATDFREPTPEMVENVVRRIGYKSIGKENH